MTARLTVLLPVFNAERYLPEALDSMDDQTFSDYKMILCDDGSSDGSIQLIRDFAKRNENVLVLENEVNLGLPRTLNKCLDYVNTEYVARMDADDISVNTRLEKQIEFLDANPDYAVVSCNCSLFDEDGEWGQRALHEVPNKHSFKTADVHLHGGAMVRTAVMKEVGGYTDNKYVQRIEDYYLWYKIYRRGYKGFNISEILYAVREDQKALLRRDMPSRIRAAAVRTHVLRKLGVKSFWFYGPLPLVKGLVPASVAGYIRRKRFHKNANSC